jgi:hypothetical protein
MKKIVSLVIFTAALAWSWNLIHSSQAIGFETHSGIQEKLAILIKQTVLAKRPNARNFKISRLWTESLSDTKVRAVFAYSFSETSEDGQNTDQSVEGEAILFREPKDESKMDKWKLQSVKTTNDAVSFTDGVVVTPSNPAEEGTIVDPDPGLTAPVATPSDSHGEPAATSESK